MIPSPLILGVSGQVDTFGFDPKEEGPLPSPPAIQFGVAALHISL